MKKLMAILFVLALVNVANAGVVDLQISSLNGTAITPTKEITINPTDIVNFDIIYDGSSDPGLWLGSLATEIVVTGPGKIVNAVNASSIPPNQLTDVTWPTDLWNMDYSYVVMNTDPANGGVGDPLITSVYKTFQNMPGRPTPQVVLDHFLLHCEDVGTVTLKLIENSSAGVSYELDATETPVYPIAYGDGVVIHQTPEPMTLTLLGLGSLFLARRKK